MHTSFGRRRAVTSLVAAAMMVLGLTMVVNSPVRADATFELERIAGENRFGTAAAIAVATYPSASTAIVANGRSFPDPLAASYLAGARTAPILLAETNTVPQATLDALDALGVADVILVGGPAVLSPTVRAQLEAEGYAVSRVSGDNRYATARAIAEAPGAENVGSTGSGVTAFLATGLAFPDSLSVGGGAYAGQLPLLLTRPGSLHPEAQTAFDNLAIEHVVILGGTSAVSEAVQTAIEESGRTTERLEGANRFQTNVAVAEWLIANLTFSTTHVDVATGRSFADALAGSTHSGENTRVILLTGSVPSAVCTFLDTNQETLEGGSIFGGPSAVDTQTKDGLETCAGRGDFRAGVVTEVDTTNAPDGEGGAAKKAGSYNVSDEGAGTLRSVEYDATNDTFEVDGNPATLAAFESNLTVGDEIEFLDDTEGDDASTAEEDEDADVHSLTNVSDRNEGMVGNANTAADTFVIVEPRSGSAISTVKDYEAGSFTVDGDPATLSEFEQDINEGDHIAITDNGTDFALTNRTISGAVSSFNVLVDEVSIGNLGDDATNAQDARYDWDTGALTTSFVVNGTAVTQSTFEDELSVPDNLAYARRDGAQVFSLTNVAPPTVSGVATGGITPAAAGGGGGLAPDFPNDIIKVVNGSTTTTVDYTGVARYFANNVLVTEAEWEAHYTAGDQITLTPDDASTAANESSISLKDANLVGHLADVNTAENRYDVINASGAKLYENLDYTAAVFGGSDSYEVNGLPAIEQIFENAISGADANDRITVEPGPVDDPSTHHAFESVS